MSIGSINTSLSGMLAARQRLGAAASNIANADSTGRIPGADGASNAYRPVGVRQTAVEGAGVDSRVEERRPAFGFRSDPDSPDADARGLVAEPAVDVTRELVDVIQARISYQASAKVMAAADDMLKKTLDISL